MTLTKTLAWLLTLVLLIGTMPLAALASEDELPSSGNESGETLPGSGEDKETDKTPTGSGEEEENLPTEPTPGNGEGENTTPGGNDDESKEDVEDSDDIEDAEGGGLNTTRTMMGIMPLSDGGSSSGATIDMSDDDPPESGEGWEYANNVYTILDEAEVTVIGSNQVPATSLRRLTVDGGATAAITLNGVTIEGLIGNQSPLIIPSGAKLTLNLPENSTNTLTAGTGYAGMSVPSGATLIIDGTGKLTATGTGTGAGIGGNSRESAGTIKINGGTVTAIGGGTSAAGIGGGGNSSARETGGNGGHVTISGGTVTANGSGGGAGIGGGGSGGGSGSGRDSSGGNGGTIIISGGTVTAVGGNQGGAGIGGGAKTSDGDGTAGDGGTIEISGGTVTATGSVSGGGAGIGGGGCGASSGSGNAGSGGNIIIRDGKVKARAIASGAGIGGGGHTGSGTGTGGDGGKITISGGEVEATGSAGGGASIGGGRKGAGGTVNITGGTVIAQVSDTTVPAISAGSGASGGTISVDGGFDYLVNPDSAGIPARVPERDIFYNDTETFAADKKFLYIKLEQVPTYTVTFSVTIMSPNSDEPDDVKVAERRVFPDELIAEPPLPTRVNTTFVGWYTDAALTDKWNFDTAVTADITLYAKQTNYSIYVGDAEVENPTVEAIEDAITETLAPAGATVTVTGKFIDADNRLTISIPSGKRVIWEADYSGSVDGDTCMIRLQHDTISRGGEMVLSGDGVIENSGTATTVNVANGVKLTIDKGSDALAISNTTDNYAITLYNVAVLNLKKGKIDNRINAEGSSTVMIEGGAVEYNGKSDSDYVVLMSDDSALMLTGGSVTNTNTACPCNVVSLRDNTGAKPFVYVAGIGSGIVDGGISRQSDTSTDSVAFYMNEADKAKFNTTGFTEGSNLFRLDEYTLTDEDDEPYEYDADDAHPGTVTATFPEVLNITGITGASPETLHMIDKNAITFVGKYDTGPTGLSLTIDGELAGGRSAGPTGSVLEAASIPVSFNPAAFGVNIATQLTEVEIKGLTAANGTYTGLPQQGYSGTAVFTLVDGNGDDDIVKPKNPALTGRYTGRNGTEYGPTTTPPTNVGDYSVTLTLQTDLEYVSDTTAPINFTIEKATLTPSGINFNGVSGKAYDGTTVITGTQPTITLNGAVNGEAPKVTADFAFATPDAGEYKVVDATNVMLDDDGGKNYALTSTAVTRTSTLAITPAPLTITDAEIAEKTFDGTADAAVTDVTFDGLVPGESFVLDEDYDATATFNNANAGTGRTVTVAVTLTGMAANNYSLSENTISLTGQNIAKATGLIATPPATIMLISTDTDRKTFNLNNIELNRTDTGGHGYSLGTFSDTTGVLYDAPTLISATMSYRGAGKDAGSATQIINIHPVNYEDISVAITFTATKPSQTISLSQSRLILIGNETGTLEATVEGGGMRLGHTWLDARTYRPLAENAPQPGVDINGTAITVSPREAAEGSYILRISNRDTEGRERSWAECRVDIRQTPTGPPDYPVYRLDPTSLSISSRQATGVPVAHFGLWPNADAKTPISLLTPGTVIQFKEDGGASVNPNEFFQFDAVDENWVAVSLIKTQGMASRYSGELEIILPGGGEVKVSGKLTISVNGKTPTLKAAAVTINTFYDNRTAPLIISGAEVTELKVAADNRLSWAELDGTSTSPTISIPDASLTGKASGTLRLEAKLAGWGETWYKVDVKVNHVHTPPALRLANTKMAVFMHPDLARDNVLILRPRSAKETLAGLKVTGVAVDPASPKAAAFSVTDYDKNSGAITIWADREKGESALRGPLPLLVSVEEADNKVKLNASVSTVKADARISLRADKKSLSLNPNLRGGESATINLSTNVAGFDLAAFPEKINVQVFDGKDKAKEKTDINKQPGKISASVDLEDNSRLTVSVNPNAEFGKSYIVELTLPGVNVDKKGELQDATLRLTVRTLKESSSTEPASKNFHGPKATLSTRGRMDLSTDSAAIINARLTNYNGQITDTPAPVFEITQPAALGGGTWRSDVPEDNFADNFTITPAGPNSWEIEPGPDAALAPGNYGIRMISGTIGSGDSVSTAKAVRLTIAATKPRRVTPSPNRITLYDNDPASRGVVEIDLPEGFAAISDVTLRGAILTSGPNKGSDNPNFPYIIHQLDSGTYAIMLDNEKKPEVLAKAKKSAALTLEIWLEGNAGSKPVTTTKVTVLVNRG